MPAKVLEVDHRRDEVAEALKQARDIISARGYQPFFRPSGDGPLNISNALTLACGRDRDLYLKARQSFSSNWGGPVAGLLNWETEKRRSLGEVIDLFGKVLDRLDSNETGPTGSSPRRSGSRARS